VCKQGGIVALAYLTEIGCVYMELSEDVGSIEELLKFKSGELESILLPQPLL